MTTERRKGRVTMMDVARLARVDPSVVSRLVNDDPRLSIREETRRRVLKAIEQLNYRPNAAARSLRTARANAVGMLIPDYHNLVYASIISGAERAARARGSLLLTGSTGAGKDALGQFVDLVGQGRVDALLIAGIPDAGSVIAQLDESLPTLALNRRDAARRRYVILDDEAAARLAVTHLVGLGHRRVAHIAGPASADTAARRREGYEAGLAQAGLTPSDELIVEGDYTTEGGEAAMTALLEREVGATAVFVANVASAVGALAAARRRSVAVPEEISVVAIHDHPLAGYLVPPLTTVRMPLEGLGVRGVELVATTSPETPIHEVVRGAIELVARESTSPPSRR